MPRPRLPRAVYWFGATSLANDLASEMIYPLLPAFVTRTLGGSALMLGLLDGIADATAAGFKVVSGYLAERTRLRGPMVVAGYGVAAVVRPLIAMAGAAWHVVTLRALDRVGKGVRTAPRDVMIADATPPDMRGRAFGVHRGADHAGAIAGPLLAAGLLAVGMSVRGVIWVAVVPGLLTVVLAMAAVRCTRTAQAPAGTAVPAAEGAMADGGTGRNLLFGTMALAAFLRAPETLLILRAQDLGVAVAGIPLLWAALHVVRSASSYPGGMLADHWGPRRTLATGWLLYASLSAAFAWAHTTTWAIAVFLAFGAVAGLTESPERALVAAAQPSGRRGRGFGWYHGAVSAVALPGAVLFGWLYQAHGAALAFSTSAAVTVAAVGMLGVVAPPSIAAR